MSSPSKSIFWLSFSRIISLVLLFLAYTQLFRYLGPEMYGRFQFTLSFVALFGVVIDFGIQQYIVKKISEDKSRAKHYFHNFLAVEVVLAVLVYGALLSVAYYNGYEPLVMKAIAVAGLGVATNALCYPFLAVMTAFYDLKRVAFINFMSSATNVTIIAVTIWSGGSIVMLVSQQVIYSFIALTLYYIYVRKHIPEPQVIKGMRTLNWDLIKTMFVAALPFALLVGFSTVYNKIDIVLITKILGYSSTGVYGVAYKFYELAAFFPAVVSHTLYPLFTTLVSTGRIDDLRVTFERYLRLMIALALPMSVGAMLLARPLILLLGGEEYAAGAPVLAILAWAPAILFIYIVANAIVISQLTKFAVLITGVNVFVNIIGNLILLPRVGLVGAAIMTLISEALQGMFYFYFVRKKIMKFAFFSLLWRPIIASAVMGGVLWYSRDLPLFIVIPLGAVVYGVSLLLLKFFRKDDIDFVKSFAGRS